MSYCISPSRPYLGQDLTSGSHLFSWSAETHRRSSVRHWEAYAQDNAVMNMVDTLHDDHQANLPDMKYEPETEVNNVASPRWSRVVLRGDYPGGYGNSDHYLGQQPHIVAAINDGQASEAMGEAFWHMEVDTSAHSPYPTCFQRWPTATSSDTCSDSDNGMNNSANTISKVRSHMHDASVKCPYPGCTSRMMFTRPCDLRKHYKRHFKTLFCRYANCPSSSHRSFSSRKDRNRHETKHNPSISCDWPDCPRKFSRLDNMKDHVRRIHQRREKSPRCDVSLT